MTTIQIADRGFEDLETGTIGSSEYVLGADDIAVWYDILGLPAAATVPMSFSLNWLLEALRLQLGGIPSGGVLTRHELHFGTTPGMGATLETTVAIVDLQRRRGLPRVALQLDSTMDGEIVVRDTMHLIWPDDSVVKKEGGSGGSGRPDPDPIADDDVMLAGSFTQADINRYADLTGDYNPMHVDPETARKAGFDDAIAHGPMPLGFVFAGLFPGETQWEEGFSLDARFLGPTYPGLVGRVVRVDGEHTNLVGPSGHPLIVTAHSGR